MKKVVITYNNKSAVFIDESFNEGLISPSQGDFALTVYDQGSFYIQVSDSFTALFGRQELIDLRDFIDAALEGVIFEN